MIATEPRSPSAPIEAPIGVMPAEVAPTTSRHWLGAGILLAVFGWLAWSIRMPAILLRNDDALYLLLARSLRSFHYVDAHIVGNPIHSQYPPGYPAILAGASAVFGDHLDVYIAVGLLASTLALALFFDVVRRLWSPNLALLVLAALAFNVPLLEYSGEVIAEPVFLGFIALTLWAMAVRPSSTGQALLAGTAAICAALVRSPGLAMIAALLLVFLLERRYRTVGIFAAAAAATAGTWLLWTVLSPIQVRGRSYVADAIGRPGSMRSVVPMRLLRALRQTSHYVTVDIERALSLPTTPSTLLDNVLWIAVVVGLGSLGLWICWKRWRVAAVFLFAYAGMLTIWAWWSPRFLMPIIPLVILAIFVGGDHLGRRYHRTVGWVFAVAFSLLLVVQGFRGYAHDRHELRDCDRSRGGFSAGCMSPDMRSFVAAAQFAGQQTPPDAVFYAVKEATWAWYSGRKTAYAAEIFRADSLQFLPGLKERGIDYVLLGRTTRFEVENFSKLLADHCHDLELTGTFPPRTYIFHVGGGSGSPDACVAIARYRADSTRVQPQRK
ncbi:MAG: glycosyltransferase family 39 protein [Gemmatimonadota bacterium]